MNVISVFHLQEQVSLIVMTSLIITGIIMLSGSQVYTVNSEYRASGSHQGAGGKTQSKRPEFADPSPWARGLHYTTLQDELWSCNLCRAMHGSCCLVSAADLVHDYRCCHGSGEEQQQSCFIALPLITALRAVSQSSAVLSDTLLPTLKSWSGNLCHCGEA